MEEFYIINKKKMRKPPRKPYSPFNPNRLRGKEQRPPYSPTNPNDGNGGREFNIFNSQQKASTNDFNSNVPRSVVKNRNGVSANFNRNVQVRNGQVRIGNKVYKTFADGSVLTGRFIPPSNNDPKGKKCQGSCKYKIKRRGLFNNDKFSGSCKPVGDGCMCGQLVC